MRVLIVADDPLARTGLAALLAERDGCTVVGQLPGDDKLAAEALVYRPAVLLWDLGWEADAVDLPDFSESAWPVIALVPDVALGPAVQSAGARGVLRRDAPPETLIAALGAACAGLSVFDAALRKALFPARADLPLAAEFTPRELDVLRLLVDGLSNRAIAQQLAISDNTVKFHLNAILGKLNAQSRTEAVVSAIRLGVITV